MDIPGGSARKALAFGLLTLILLSLGMAILAVAGYPAFFSQPGARTVLWEPICALLVYAFAVVLVSPTEGARWEALCKTAIVFGAFTGILEIINMGIENGVPFSAPGPALPIGFMVTVFMLWGVAGFRAARGLGSPGAGLVAAVLSACSCIVIAVAAGFLTQFFLARPDPAMISLWAEYQRSGWTDPRAFGVANVLDSGFTHLVEAPIVASFVGCLGVLLARIKPVKK